MTMQWRTKDKGSKTWENWEDVDDGDILQLDMSLPLIDALEVREKPSFGPRYFREVEKPFGHSNIYWWPAPPWELRGTLMKESNWVRVEVVDVDEHRD
jgi:hypothetical protein